VSIDPTTACEKDFPGQNLVMIGTVHTHPPEYARPLESLGDILTFALHDEAIFNCTATAWGVSCMHRAKEPATVYNVPRIDKNGDPVYDADGKLVYDVKSDVVDWDRTMRFTRRDMMDSVFIASIGNADKEITGMLMHAPYFPPLGKKSSIIRSEAPFKFGKEKGHGKFVGEMYCESFMDIVGRDAKVRTVCNDDKAGDNFYAEAGIKPTMIPLYSETGFPTNMFIDEDLASDIERVRLKKENSKFIGYFDKKRDGYHVTESEIDATMFRQNAVDNVPVETKKLGAINLKKSVDISGVRTGKKYCEYVLLSNPATGGIKGKPAGILCRSQPRIATGETCIVM
jgi:hypothetical protein